MPDKSGPEVMLAQEQAVIRRGVGVRKGVEAAFGAGGETEGTLVLTDRRLVYVHGNEKETDLRVGIWSAKRLYFSDVESLGSMSMDSSSWEIDLSEIEKVVGRKGEGRAPRLEVSWNEGQMLQSIEFVQQILGRSRKKNLSDWAKVIEKLMDGKLKIAPVPAAPEASTLEARVLEVLGDMQEKGAFTIEQEVEGDYKIEVDPDDVEAACGKLASAGLVKKFSPKGEEPYYRKISPLGDDDLGA